MTPALAAAAGAEAGAPLRLAFAYVPNGVTMEQWTPAAEGAGFELTRILKPLAPVKDRMLVLSGLEHDNGNALGDGPGDHARAGAVFLTGVHCRKTAGADIKNGVSVDQIAARQIGSQTRLGSIELGCEDTRVVGNCDSGYSCAYTNSLSWRSETTPQPPETNPRAVFERLFGVDAGLDPATRAQRLRTRRSILDLVGERSAALRNDLGASDRRKLDEYFTAVREIEQRIAQAESHNSEWLPEMEKPSGIPETFAEHVSLMFDLQALAFQADITRIATMMIAREGSTRTYPEIGVADPHHPLTHHRNNPEWIEKVTQINEFHMGLFAKFIQKLASDAGGRRHAARPLDDRLRQRHRRRQPAHAPRPAGAAGRQRRRRARPGAAHPLRQGHADDEPLHDAARSDGRASGVDRRQHRATSSTSRTCSARLGATPTANVQSKALPTANSNGRGAVGVGSWIRSGSWRWSCANVVTYGFSNAVRPPGASPAPAAGAPTAASRAAWTARRRRAAGARSTASGVSPGIGTTSRPVPQTLEYSSSSRTPKRPSDARAARTSSSSTGSISPQ